MDLNKKRVNIETSRVHGWMWKVSDEDATDW